MAAQTYLDQINDRVERLLRHHAELKRTNALLAEQVNELGAERDALKLQLQTAVQFLDSLLKQIPQANGEAP